jgi:hypothetical protein
MSSNIFVDLDAIRLFLAEDVAAHTPKHLRSELRAAIKILADVTKEIDVLPALLFAEGRDMVALAEAAIVSLNSCDVDMSARTSTVLLRDQFAQPMGSLRGLIRLHQEARADAELILAELQARLRCPDMLDALRGELQALVGRYLKQLAAHADARMPWQSVFPPIGPEKLS